MSSILYHNIFNVLLEHSFFTNKLCTNLQIVPSSHTVELLKQYGIKLKKNTNGIAAYINANKATPTEIKAVNKLPEGFRMVFLLIDPSATFLPITTLPPTFNLNKIFVFTNKVNNVSSAKPLLVSNTGTKQLADTDVFEYTQGFYSHTQAAVADSTVSINIPSAQEKYDIQAKLNNSEIQASFNLNNSIGGMAALQVNGGATIKSFYVLPSNIMDKVIGVVEIYASSTLATDYQFQAADGTLTTRNYLIPFTAASVKLKYKIQRKLNDAVTSVSVEKTAAPAIAFTTAVGTEPNSFVCTGNTSMALQEAPVRGIVLKNQSGTVLIPNLPNPTINQLRLESGGQLTAEILVTV